MLNSKYQAFAPLVSNTFPIYFYGQPRIIWGGAILSTLGFHLITLVKPNRAMQNTKLLALGPMISEEKMFSNIFEYLFMLNSGTPGEGPFWTLGLPYEQNGKETFNNAS